MLARLAAYARWNVVLFVAGVGVPAALSACGDAGTGSEQSGGARPVGPMEVLAQYEGGYDGEHFWYRPMAIGDTGIGGASGDDRIGTVHQKAEVDIPNDFAAGGAAGAAGAAGAGGAPQTNEVLIEQMEFHDQTTWNTANCGPTPTNGSCVRWRLMNAFPNNDLFRSYFYLTSLTPPSGCPAGCTVTVGIPAPAADTQTSTNDAALLGTTPATGTFGSPGLWRFGLLERATPEPRGRERWLAFTGSGVDPRTGRWSFHWVGQVRGVLVKPTVRGNLVNNSFDKAPFYTSNGFADAGMVSGSNIQATPDGRYVVFGSSSVNLSPNGTVAGNKVFRYDTTNGAVTVINVPTGGTTAPAGCNAYQPSISSDGTRVAFQSVGCDLGFGIIQRAIYLRDIAAGTTALVSHGTASLATPPDSDSIIPRISGDGNFVTFTSAAGNLVAGRPASRLGRIYDVYRYNVGSGLIERANIPISGPSNWPNLSQQNPDISNDGAIIVFDSQAQGFASGADRAVNNDVFLYDFGGSGIRQLSVSSTGALQQGSEARLPSISSDGSTVAFVAYTGTGNAFVTTPAATAGKYHVYRRSAASAATITMIDTAAAGTTTESSGSVGLVPPSLNADGSVVVYSSTAGNLLRTANCNTPSLACMPTPGVQNAFMRDMLTPDPEVQRSFLVSLVRSKLTSNAQPYAAAAGGINTTNSARAVQIIGPRDGATAVYLASGGNSTDWAQFNGAPNIQIYLSPASDSTFQ